MAASTSKAKQNEWYSKNHMGHIVCKLCTTEHRDEANFLLHVESKKHNLNLDKVAKAKEIFQREKDAALRLRQMNAHDSHAAAMSGLVGGENITLASAQAPKMTTLGRPAMRGPLFESYGDACKVFFELSYPNADTSALARPMHKWMGSREQHIESQDDAVIYLVFACPNYDSVAFTFPADAAVSELTGNRSADEYFCDWDPLNKKYTLMFTVRAQSVQ